MSILTKNEIMKLVQTKEPLITNMPDLSTQIQGVGIDLTVNSIEHYSTRGTIDLYNTKREISETKIEAPITIENQLHGYNLKNHGYKIKLNEFLNIPNNIMGIAHTRSSMLRCGAYVESAVFDPGYKGNIEVLLHVVNPNGIRIMQDAKITQLVFHKLENDTEPYDGIYQFHKSKKI